jgi:hypothetical protein
LGLCGVGIDSVEVIVGVPTKRVTLTAGRNGGLNMYVTETRAISVAKVAIILGKAQCVDHVVA